MGPTELTTSASSDLPRRHHPFPPLSPVDGGKGLGSMNMDDLLQNIYPAENPQAVDPVSREAGKTVEEVWREISGEKKAGEGEVPEAAAGRYGTEVTMTLEDYLARAGVVGDVEVGGVVGQQQGVVDGGMMVLPVDYGHQQQKEEGFLGFGDGGLDDGSGGVGGGRGRRILQDQADKVAQQRQRRMIKNRESAARSRERKQAYTIELESKVARLEEQNSELKQQEEDRRRKRLKHLLETRIPVIERKNTRRCLPKTLSM